MTDAERVRALRPYLKHFGDCAFMAGGGVCDCGLYRVLGIGKGEEKGPCRTETSSP